MTDGQTDKDRPLLVEDEEQGDGDADQEDDDEDEDQDVEDALISYLYTQEKIFKKSLNQLEYMVFVWSDHRS